jgi:hypothetical protein
MDNSIENELESQMGGTDSKNDGLGLGVAHNPEKNRKNIANRQLDSVGGYKPLGGSSLPSKLMFNEKGCTTKIRSANLDEIKFYSSMDEDDEASIDEGITYILKNCLKVSGGDYRDLTVTDKLNSFFAIRDYTMLNTDSKNEVIMKFASKKDGEIVEKQVNSSLFEHYDIHEDLLRFYNEEERCFTIPLDNESFNIYVPKVGVIEVIKKYISKIQSESRVNTEMFLDKKFVVYAQYLIQDWRMVKEDDDYKYLSKLKEDYNSWDAEKHQIFDYAVNLLKTGIKPTVKIKFENGELETFPMTFRKYKSLFFVSNKLGVLFPSSK